MDKPTYDANHQTSSEGQLAQTLNATMAAAKGKIAKLNAAWAAKNLREAGAGAHVQLDTKPSHGNSQKRS